MAEPGDQGLLDLVRVERDLRRRADRAATDLAEEINVRLLAGVSVEAVAKAIGWPTSDVEALLQREATRVYNRQYNRERWQAIKAGRVQPYHGSSEGVAAGCQCESCSALRERRRRQGEAKRRAGLPSGHPAHGTPEGYTRFGCRCDACWRAQAKYRRRLQGQPGTRLTRRRRKQREREQAPAPVPLLPWEPVADADPRSWRELRQRAGVSMTAVAKQMGVDITQVSRWEHGRVTPGPDARRRYLDALNQLALAARTAKQDEES